ncbi:hypothetical protein ACFQ09_25180 [Massilia norwichensis]|uniref:Uncharacterized protein n=1 Tax=Massilia norwichensis TaxID=1442366 RepID=A0ABT2ABQ5_9BURK|nr:hypothetical protein [Massilia norwichensis]MCS0591650.1 hypothetical protein [Massilia norwichensis]
MSETHAVIKSASTTTPRETYIEVDHAQPDDGVLLYRPDDNSFIALYPDEWRDCRADGHQNKTAIEELQDANRAVTEKSLILQNLLQQPNSAKADIAQARKELDEALNTLSQKSEAAKKCIEAITDQKTDPNKLVELLPLTMKRIEGKTHTPIYVSAKKLKSALEDKRVYMVEGSAERKKDPKEKIFNGMTLNVKEVRKRIGNQVRDQAKFEKKWKCAPKDADHFSGILTDWAKVMGASATSFLERGQKEIIEGIFGTDKSDPDNPYRMVDMKPEAQLLRWTAGAGAEVTFMPCQGNFFDKRDKNMAQRFKRAAKAAQFSVKANAEASFAVGEAKVETIMYLPHAAGWHLDTNALDHPLDLGYFRLRGDVTLYALAGASVALEADASLMITGDKQGLRGTPKNKAGAKAKVGAKGEAKIFAGLKEGVSLAGALQWLNPEGFVNPGKPKKADLNKAIAAYVDVASVSADAALIQGLAASLGFECAYRNGNFVVAAKAGACLGLGGSGSVGAKVGLEQIAQFFMCIVHQLKQSDFKRIPQLMAEAHFYIFNKIMYLASTRGSSLESFVGARLVLIEEKYENLISSLQQSGDNFIKHLEHNINSGWGWHAYLPPESRGALIKSLIEAAKNNNSSSNDLQKLAAFLINELLSTTQSTRHLEKTLERVTFTIGERSDRSSAVRAINLISAGTIFENCVDRCETRLAESSFLKGRPFLRNDEPEIKFAELSLHHPGYLT